MGINPSRFSACGDNCPVEQVSWDDAQNSSAPSMQKQGTYRLPTEAEWEYACRSAGKGRRLPERDHLKASSGLRGRRNSAAAVPPVATREPNGLGIYDMNSSNVWEWVRDTLRHALRHRPHPNNPVLETGEKRVLRGGSWDSKAPVRCQIRNRTSRTAATGAWASASCGSPDWQRSPATRTTVGSLTVLPSIGPDEPAPSCPPPATDEAQSGLPVTPMQVIQLRTVPGGHPCPSPRP